MNIAFLFAWMPGERWSNPLSVVNECKRRNINYKIFSLFDENKQYTNKNLYSLYQQKDIYDLIFHMDYGVFDDPLLSKEHFPNSFMVMEAGDDPQKYELNLLKAHKFDLVLTPDLISLEKYKKEGIKAEYWTHWADFTYGSENPMIRPMFDAVSTRGIGDTVFLDQIQEKLKDRFLNKRCFDVLQRDILSLGKIVLHNSRYQEISRRVFEGMYCNRMVMTDRLPEDRGLQLLFRDKEDIVYYDDLEDAINKINYYSQNDEERLRITKNGYKKVLYNHTNVQRLQFVLSLHSEFISK